MPLLKHRDIVNEHGNLYMRRWRIWGWIPGAGNKNYWSHLYVHKIVRPDSDRELHNHPWKFSISLVLWGGYFEERMRTDGHYRWKETRYVRPWRINVFTKKDFHRITTLPRGHAITLFFALRKVQSWGFIDLVTGYVTPWRERLKERGIPIPTESE